MLLANGQFRGQQVLSSEAVRLMMTGHVASAPDHPFLDGHGWGFGGSVDLAPTAPWNISGRYGWVGGTGTAAYVFPSQQRLVVWMSQVELNSGDFAAMGAILTWAAQLQ